MKLNFVLVTQLSVLPPATLSLPIRLRYNSQLYQELVGDLQMIGSSTVPESESRTKMPRVEIPTSTEITLPDPGIATLAPTPTAHLIPSLLLLPRQEVETLEFPLPSLTTIRTNYLLPPSTPIPPAPTHLLLLPLAFPFLTIPPSQTLPSEEEVILGIYLS